MSPEGLKEKTLDRKLGNIVPAEGVSRGRDIAVCVALSGLDPRYSYPGLRGAAHPSTLG